MHQGDAQEPTTGLLTGGGANESDPTQIVNMCNDNNVTISTSNCSPKACQHRVMHAHPDSQPSLAATARHLFGAPTSQYLSAINIATLQAMADIGATSIFIMEGILVKNIWPAQQNNYQSTYHTEARLINTPMQHNNSRPPHCFDWSHCTKIVNCIFGWHTCPVQSGMQSSVHLEFLQCNTTTKSFYRGQRPIHRLMDITNQRHRGHD
jgi:hypothetical protein